MSGWRPWSLACNALQCSCAVWDRMSRCPETPRTPWGLASHCSLTASKWGNQYPWRLIEQIHVQCFQSVFCLGGCLGDWGTCRVFGRYLEVCFGVLGSKNKEQLQEEKAYGGHVQEEIASFGAWVLDMSYVWLIRPYFWTGFCGRRTYRKHSVQFYQALSKPRGEQKSDLENWGSRFLIPGFLIVRVHRLNNINYSNVHKRIYCKWVWCTLASMALVVLWVVLQDIEVVASHYCYH